MERVLAQAAQNGLRATVTAVERALGIPHATFDRNYRHLIDTFRQRAQQQAAAARPAGPVSAGNDPDQVIQRLRRENEDLRRLVRSTPNPYASSPWTTSNSKPSSMPPPALQRFPAAETAD
jgi:hypothetical protein